MGRIVVIMLLLTIGAPLYGQEADSEPAKTVTIPADLYVEMIQKMEYLSAIEKLYKAMTVGVPVVTLNPVSVVLDQNGRVFLRQPLTGEILLGSRTYSFTSLISGEVARREPKECVFCFRLKAGAYVDATAASKETRFGGAVLFEPLHYGIFGLNVYGGSTSAGGALSLDLTKNFGAFGGAGFDYYDQSLAIVAGLAFSFN